MDEINKILLDAMQKCESLCYKPTEENREKLKKGFEEIEKFADKYGGNTVRIRSISNMGQDTFSVILDTIDGSVVSLNVKTFSDGFHIEVVLS